MPHTLTPTPDAETSYFTFHRVSAGGDCEQLQRIYALRYEVYCLECGFLPAEEYRNGLESDEYDDHVEHFMALNLADEVVGTLRLVLPTHAHTFPYEHHCAGLFDGIVLPPRQQCGEVSRLVVRKTYRRRQGDLAYGVSEAYLSPGDDHDRRQAEAAQLRSQVAPALGQNGENRRLNSPLILLGLYRAVYRYSLETGVRYWFAAMERSLARTLARFDFVFRQIGAEADYYGPVAPYLGDLREIEQLVGAADPALLEWLQRSDLRPGCRSRP